MKAQRLAAAGMGLVAVLVLWLSASLIPISRAGPAQSPVTPAGLLPFVVRTAPTPTPLPADLHITQLRYDTADEYVEITNQGGEAQVMTGWRIQSVVGGQWYAFPDGYVLAPGAVVRVHSGPEAPNNPPADLLWGYAYVWLNEGDKAVLYDDADQEIDSACYLSGCP